MGESIVAFSQLLHEGSRCKYAFRLGNTERWRDGRVAEGVGLLNRFTGKTVTGVRIPLSPPLFFRFFGQPPRNFAEQAVCFLFVSKAARRAPEYCIRERWSEVCWRSAT